MKQSSTHTVCRRLFSYIARHWVAFTIAIIGSAMYAGVDAWFVNFLKPFLDKGLVAQDRAFLKWAPLLIIGVFILRGAASFLSNYGMAVVARNIVMRLRQDMFAHFQRLPARYYDRVTSGQLISSIIFNVEQVADASADAWTTVVQSSFLILGLLWVMIHTSWKLTLLYFVTLPMIASVVRLSSMRMRRLSRDIQVSMGLITHRAQENIDGYREVRAFGAQKSEIEKFSQLIRLNRLREMKMVITKSLSISLTQLIGGIALSITIYIAVSGVFRNTLTAGGFMVMIAAMLALLKPMKDLTNVNNKIQRGLAGADSVFKFLDEPGEKETGSLSLVRATGLIECQQLSFSYDPDKAVLRHVHFTIHPGEIVALVGHSGSGKSTIARLLPRFYEGYTGAIKIDGIEISNYRLKDLRQQFAFVPQHVTLFDDSIANNIALGLENISLKAIEAAARSAHAMEFIEKLPQGLHTLIGENGVLLSGGQRQRIAIARAILKDAPLLILDEATSALDTASERHIQLALEKLMQSRTTLVIAHRLSTIEKANRIIVMENGTIAEEGDHHTLLEKNGIYATLYRMQFRDNA